MTKINLAGNSNLISMKLILLFLSFFIWVSSSNAQINVKDFGAKGDGISDDTKSIENAIQSILKNTFSAAQLPNKLKTSAYVGSSQSLYFPSGIYLISKPIKLGSYMFIQGDNSIISGTEKYLKTSGSIGFDGVGWQVRLEGMQFVGFNTALKINNNNVDQGNVRIEHCNFYDNNTAIELTAQSSISEIRSCRFLNNSKSLNIIAGDKVIFEKNWVTASALSGDHDANIINRGMLSFNDNLLVPMPPAKGAYEPAWINNFGSVSIDQVRQGGEPGSFTLVNNFASLDKDYPIIPNYVVVKNSDCYSAYNNQNKTEPAVIRLFEMPNQLVLEDIRGAVDARLISCSGRKISNPSDWIKQYFTSSKIIKIRISNILGGMEESNGDLLPAYLKSFAEADNYKLARSKNAVQEQKSTNIPAEKRQSGKNNSEYKYEFLLNDISANYMIVYSGNPNVNGSGHYNGGFVANFKCNGVYHNGKVSHQLSTSPVYNMKDEENGKERPYQYTMVWQSTGNAYKLVSDPNFNVVVVVSNSTGYERFNIINLNTLN